MKVSKGATRKPSLAGARQCGPRTARRDASDLPFLI
jgi:hypothetical protein